MFPPLNKTIPFGAIRSFKEDDVKFQTLFEQKNLGLYRQFL
jgi:hypothetical protein